MKKLLAKKRARKPRKTVEDEIIEDATTDAYGEWEQLAGWACVLEENLKTPQECRANKNPAVLLKVKGPDSTINALINCKGARLLVPIETIELKDKRQDAYIRAYKKWLKGGGLF